MNIRTATDRYIDFFEKLSPEDTDRLGEVMTADVHFRDPFNDVTGLDAVRRVFAHMYEVLDDPRFEIVERWENGNSAILKWRFFFNRAGGETEIVGMSEVRFAEDGRAVAHLDYWDPARDLYEQVPVLGWVLGRIRNHLSAS